MPHTTLLACLGTVVGHEDDAAPQDRGVGANGLEHLGLVGRSEPFCRALEMTGKLARYHVPGAAGGGDGHRQGTIRTGAPLPRAAARPALRAGQLLRPARYPGRSELFGHVTGAYTGARGQMQGLVAQAEGGTLFLDEVHCLSPKGQATLLRFTQDHHYRPLGAGAQRRANVRIVAATNQAIGRCVAEGQFREDLFYRLNVGRICLPPLRRRSEDIPLLVECIVERLCARYDLAPRRFDAVSLAWLAAQPWPGNVRELENFVLREFILSDETVIHIDPRRGDIPTDDATATTASAASFKEARTKALADFDCRYLRTMLSLTGGNVSEAARRAGQQSPRVRAPNKENRIEFREEFAPQSLLMSEPDFSSPES